MKNSGFTLIELMVVVAIMAIISGIGLASYGDFQKKQTVKQIAQSVIKDLRETQAKALAGEKDCSPSACGGATPGCGNDASGELPLDGWCITISGGGNTYSMFGWCSGSGTCNLLNGGLGQSFNISQSPLLTAGFRISSTTYPIQFRPLGQGLVRAATICISNFLYGSSYTYKVTISQSGEIQDVGFSPTCPL